MSKKFVAQKARAAAHIKAAGQKTLDPVVSEDRHTGPTRKGEEREKVQLDRVMSLLGQTTEFLEASRIEHFASIRDMELQLAEHSADIAYRAGSPEARNQAEWREMTQCALRHRRVRLVMIEEVLRARQKPGLFQRAVENLFDEADLADVWKEVKRLSENLGKQA